MIPSFLSFLGLIHIDRIVKLNQYRSHASYAGNFFDLKKMIDKYSYLSIFKNSSAIELFSEYISTVIQTTIFGLILYFTFTSISYFYYFKYKKSKYLPNHNGNLLIYHEIKWSVLNICGETFLVSALRMTVPRFSFIYYDINDYSVSYLILSIFFHIIFDETLTYWIHRILHTNDYLYRSLHYIHHKSIDITPFAGFAFHPLDAFAQALPTFVSCYFFPIHCNIVLFFSIITTLWAVGIHDNVPSHPIKLFLYSTHHTIHHEKGYGQLRNYGKFTSVWDRIMGTYDDPDRIDFGFRLGEKEKRIYHTINRCIDRIIPDRTTEKEKLLVRKKK